MSSTVETTKQEWSRNREGGNANPRQPTYLLLTKLVSQNAASGRSGGKSWGQAECLWDKYHSLQRVFKKLYVWVCSGTHVCRCRGQYSASAVFLNWSLPFFNETVFHWNWSSLMPRLMASKPQNLPVSFSLCWYYRYGLLHFAASLVLGSSRLGNKHVANLAISL